MKNYLLRIHYPALLILLTFIVQFFVAPELWIADTRELPAIPFFGFLPVAFGKSVDAFLIFMMFCSVFFLFLKPENKKWLLLFLLPGILLVLEDGLRMQPWFYLHMVMIGLIAFEDKIGKPEVKTYLQWIVAAVYFWGGFNKLNIAFAWEIFPWFTEHLGIGQDYYLGMHNLHAFEMPSKNNIAYIVPAFEILIAVCLFIPGLRIAGILGSFITHAVSLFAIGPYGHNWNQIVWPWNVEMPILCLLLFYSNEKIPLRDFFTAQKNTFRMRTAKLVLFLFLLAPALSFFRFWDKGLSIYLYSGNTDELEFYFEGFEQKLTQTSLAEHLYLDTNYLVSSMKPEYWVMDQTGVPMYGSPRYLKKVGKYLCGCLDHPEKGGIKLLLRNGFGSVQDTVKIPCKDL